MDPPCELLPHWFWNAMLILSALLNPTLAIHGLQGGKNITVCSRISSLPWPLLHLHEYCVWAKKTHHFLYSLHLHISVPLCDLCYPKSSLLLSHLPDYSINLQGLAWKSPHCIDSLNSMGQGFGDLSLPLVLLPWQCNFFERDVCHIGFLYSQAWHDKSVAECRSKKDALHTMPTSSCKTGVSNTAWRKKCPASSPPVVADGGLP